MRIRFLSSRKRFAVAFRNIGHFINKVKKQSPRGVLKKGVLKSFTKFTGKHLWQSLFFNKAEACNFIKKKALAQAFSCDFCKISNNTFLRRTPLVATSESYPSKQHSLFCLNVICFYLDSAIWWSLSDSWRRYLGNTYINEIAV